MNINPRAVAFWILGSCAGYLLTFVLGWNLGVGAVAGLAAAVAITLLP